DLMSDEISDFLGGNPKALNRAGVKSAAFAGAIQSLRSNFSGMIVVGVPPYPTGIPASLLSLDNAGGLGGFHRTMLAEFVEAVGRIEGVRLIDLDAVQRWVGLSGSFDARQSYLYRQPFSEVFLNRVGQQLGRIVTASRRAAKKCVVLDADNT